MLRLLSRSTSPFTLRIGSPIIVPKPQNSPSPNTSGSLRRAIARFFFAGGRWRNYGISSGEGGRESLEYDVVIVGAGPAGLSAAIRLKQLCQERNEDLSVCVVEKGAEVGAHIISGNVFEPRALDELIPNWRNEGAPVEIPVSSDKFWLLTKDRSLSLPSPFNNKGNYVISLSQLTRWMASKAEELGVEIYPGFAASEILYDANHKVVGIGTNDMGISKDGSKRVTFQRGVELRGRITLLAEGCRGSLSEKLIRDHNLREKGQGQHQTYALGIKEVKVGPLSVSPMGFGTWAWGNQLLWGYEEDMDDDLQEIFNLAIRNGINLFDTADSYGTGRLSGQSERLLGKFVREYQGRSKVSDNIVIATKFAAYPWRLTSGQFVRACKSSLERLKLEKIGIGQLHWSTANYAPLQELALWDGLVAMYEKGLVQGVGVSNYGPKQLIRIHDYLKSRGIPLCSAQVQFSLLSMGEEQMELKTVCDSLGIQMISYSPLGLGMLTGKYTISKLPRGPRALLFRQILPGLDPLLRSQKNIAQRRGKTMSQIAINWCICKGTIPIPGVKTVEQAKDNLGSLGWRLTSDEIIELESAAKESSTKMIQNIFQTR